MNRPKLRVPLFSYSRKYIKLGFIVLRGEEGFFKQTGTASDIVDGMGPFVFIHDVIWGVGAKKCGAEDN